MFLGSPSGNGGCTKESGNPIHFVILLENGKLGVQMLRGLSEAVKKGVSMVGSSGKSWTVKGGAQKSPVYLNRAMCFGMFQFLRPTALSLAIMKDWKADHTVVSCVSLADVDASDSSIRTVSGDIEVPRYQNHLIVRPDRS